MTLLVSMILKTAGVVFLMLAALGVMRFADPFQRMHAATKAGTLGAGLVVSGAIIAQGEASAAMVGVLTIIFLLLSAPVAGHLLGRAAYVSGARFALASDDALVGVLKRASAPLDERLAWDPPVAPVADLKTRGKPKVAPPGTEPAIGLRPLERVRIALIGDNYVHVARRAGDFCHEQELELSVRVVIDAQSVEAAEEPEATRQTTRRRAGEAMQGLQKLIPARRSVELAYEEGNPETLLSCPDWGETLLILPHRGWFHHGVDVKRPLTTWTPDGLLRLPMVHSGPVLYCAAGSMPAGAWLAICDNGEAHLPELLGWALKAGLWPEATLFYIGEAPDRFRTVLDAQGKTFADTERPHRDTLLPPHLAHAGAVLLGRMPRPLRTEWFGMHWHERVAPGFSGEVLVQEKSSDEP